MYDDGCTFANVARAAVPSTPHGGALNDDVWLSSGGRCGPVLNWGVQGDGVLLRTSYLSCRTPISHLAGNLRY